MLLAALIGGGFVLGFLTGRWWALAGPVAFGVYVYATAEASRFGHSDIPWGIVAIAYAVCGAIGVMGGLTARYIARRFANPS